MKPLVSINPATGSLIKSFDQYNERKIDRIIAGAYKAQKNWGSTVLQLRLACLKRLSEILADSKKEYASLMAEEMGKPLKQGIGEIEKCIWLCNYFIGNSKNYLSDKIIRTRGQKSFITFKPLGLILGIMPWNFPFWQVFRFSVPSIIAGNGVILKHAPNVQGCAFKIESSFSEAGFPKNLFQNIVISSKRVSNVIKSPKIAAITLTGSTLAGKSVAETSGKVLKKTVLELGGSDPYIILEDADIEKSINSCIEGRLLNAGQSCISAKRLIVVDKLYDQFLTLLENKLSKKIMGDPKDDVDLGPMVSIEARKVVHSQVLKSIKNGANLILGGNIPDMQGSFYPITLLSNVKPGMAAFDEEIFGPVFSVIKAENENNAIDLANNSTFGLGAAVFTKNIKKGEEIAKNRLDAGLCFVNDFVKSDPRLPFGGVKQSGYGRELSIYGLLEFINIKTIVINDD